ncbi:membrane lipoprotein lipid attachment site-containing protein [Planococcus versutus]|uniref:Lipoprotein n=1 Tax=Planococcus versutus TaxID=1302659 RepID=A0A1B1S3A8_9BACL|nr:membrane lipoprotein lipid attachment site-containing protein [Planococcus versutus]ANU27663.1 hypothetical protein I858_011765 [Planococcus versutus]
MKKVILFFILALILSGCTSQDEDIFSEDVTSEINYIFEGSNENWGISYKVDVINKKKGENQVDEYGTAKFIGEGQTPEMIDYKLATETDINSSEGVGIPIYDRIGDFAQGSCGNCVPMQGDEELELEIIWNGKSEKILLTTNE